MIARLVKASLSPLLALCAAAASVGLLLSLAEGNWRSLWPGFLGLSASFLVFPLLLIPAGMCAGIMVAFGKSKPRLAKICGVFSLAYIALVVSLYTALSFALAVNPGHPSPGPLLWAAALAVLPWGLFARKDRDNILFTGIVLTQALAAAAVAALYLAGLEMTFGKNFIAAAALIFGELMLQSLYEKAFLKEKE